MDLDLGLTTAGRAESRPGSGDGPWGCERLIRPVEEEAVRALIAHRNFEQASLTYAAAMADLHRDNWVLNRVINDRGRLTAALTMLDLHFSAGQCGFSVTDLRDRAQLHGFGSPNRATALSGALRVLGFLAPVEAADFRFRKVVPTEQFLSLYRQLLLRQLQAQALVLPETMPAMSALAEPIFLGSVLRATLTLTQAESGRHPEAGIDALAERANAMVMLYAVFVAETGGAPLPIAELARRFAVARSHVVSVMKEAEAYGLMALDPVVRTFRPSKRLRQVLHRLFADTFLTNAAACEFALVRPGPPARLADTAA